MKNRILILFPCILLCTCLPEPLLEKIYPSDIVISGEGTLKFIKTFWDAPHDKHNKRGTRIEDAKLIDNVIWILDNTKDIGTTLYKGINKSASVKLRHSNELRFRYWIASGILHKGNFFIFRVSDRLKEYNIAKVDKTTLKCQYIRVLDDYYDNLPTFYNDSKNIFIHFDAAPLSYYKINENCDDFIQITKQEFNDLYTPPPDFVTDDKGRYYRFYTGYPSLSESGYIEVSLDNGDTWHYGDMGTNRPVNIIIQNDSVYVFCDRYSAGSALSYETGGGGIHEFKWQ